jgi:hypothetical protein
VQGPPHILDMRGKGSGLSMAVWYKGTFSMCNLKFGVIMTCGRVVWNTFLP